MFKVFRDNLTHYNHKYTLGLNTLVGDFDPTRECMPGGFYVCDAKHIWRFIGYGRKLGFIELPSDTRTYPQPGCLKVDKLIVVKIMDLLKYEHIKQVFIDAATNNGMLIKHIPVDFKTSQIYDLAAKSAGYSLQHFPPEEITYARCVDAVKQNGCALQYVPDELRDQNICDIAIAQDEYAVNYIKKLR